MRLNALRPAPGARRRAKRVGRGPASGNGKTCGRGQKGQRSRSGKGTLRGFEGGQMPLQRRLPKYGFVSRKASWTAEVRLDALAKMAAETVDLPALRSAGLVGRATRRAKVIASGSLDKPVTVRGLAVSKGARAAIEAAGGTIETDNG